MNERIAVYPGSFDPPTYGHLDLIGRAARLFDRLIVAVANNDAKSAMFTAEERRDMLREITKDIPNIEVTSFEGLTVDFAQRRNAIAIVRGLRVVSDFEFELTMAITNQKLNPMINTVCLMPAENHMLVSSRLVKEVARLGGALTEFVPRYVEDKVCEKARGGGA